MTKLRFKSADQKTKACANTHLEFKADDPGSGDDEKSGGRVVGYAATFDREPDSYGDVIAKGAFTESLERWEKLKAEGIYIPLLYGHNAMDPEYNIGYVVSAKEDERGLLIEAIFDPENAKAQYVRKLVQEGRVYQFSFAYDTLQASEVELESGQKVYELQKLELFEVSLVQIPANQHATVEEIKAADCKAGRRNSKADEDALKEIANHASAIKDIVDGLMADDGNPGDDGEADGDGDGDGAKAADQATQTEFLDSYKSAHLSALGIDEKEFN